jgi:hypothetical protein
VSYTLAFALQLRKKHGKTSVRVAKEHPEKERKKQLKNKTWHPRLACSIH